MFVALFLQGACAGPRVPAQPVAGAIAGPGALSRFFAPGRPVEDEQATPTRNRRHPVPSPALAPSGPDGRLYFTVGNQGKPPTTGDGRVWTQGVVCSMNPDGTELRPVAHNFRNNFEVAADAFGKIWQNDNDDDGSEACRFTYVLPGGNYGYFSAGGERHWRVDQRQGQPVPEAHWHTDDPGVVPATEITAAARGAGFSSKRSELITASNASGEQAHWFRPSDVAVGPDGAIYMADWYDPIVGGHVFLDGKGFGRILRIAPVQSRPRALWILAAIGGRGIKPVEAALTSGDPQMRLVAFRALRGHGHDMLGYARRLAGDESAAVRRDVVLALRDVPAAQALPALLQIAGSYQASDRYLLEALGLGSKGKEEALFAKLAARPFTRPGGATGT